MTDVFSRASQVLEGRRQLVDRDPDLFGPFELPPPELAPFPTAREELAIANACYRPVSLPARTRFRALKKALLRFLSVYTSGQVAFNAAVVRILNSWSERLSGFPDEIDERLRSLQEGTNIRLSMLEQRRNVVESRFTFELSALRDRVASLELAQALAMRQMQAGGERTEGPELRSPAGPPVGRDRSAPE